MGTYEQVIWKKREKRLQRDKEKDRKDKEKDRKL